MVSKPDRNHSRLRRLKAALLAVSLTLAGGHENTNAPGQVETNIWPQLGILPQAKDTRLQGGIARKGSESYCRPFLSGGAKR